MVNIRIQKKKKNSFIHCGGGKVPKRLLALYPLCSGEPTIQGPLLQLQFITHWNTMALENVQMMKVYRCGHVIETLFLLIVLPCSFILQDVLPPPSSAEQLGHMDSVCCCTEWRQLRKHRTKCLAHKSSSTCGQKHAVLCPMQNSWVLQKAVIQCAMRKNQMCV